MITRLELQHYRRLSDHHRRSPEAKAFRHRLDEALQELDPVYRRIIVLRYCCRLSWVAIAMRVHYSVDWCYVLHRRAIKELTKAR